VNLSKHRLEAAPLSSCFIKVEIPLKIYKKLKKLQRELKKEGINPLPSVNTLANLLLEDFLSWSEEKREEFLKGMKDASHGD